MDLSVLLPAVGGLTVITNIIVQVLKKSTWDKLPTNIVVVIIAQLLTFLCGGVYVEYKAITIEWYMIACAIVTGFVVAYSAMFGFDKLKEVLQFERS